MSSLPKSIRQQVEEANKHFDRPENPEASAPAPEAPAKEPAAPETATQPAKPEQPKADDNKHSQPEDKAATDEPKRSEGYWEHRFNVINGKYAAEVPALRDEVRSLKQSLEKKEQELQALKDAPQGASTGGLTPEQIAKGKEEFGEDFVDFVQSMIAANAPKRDDSKVTELEGRVRQFEELEQQKLRTSFWTALNELVPDWQAINGDQKWLAFLAQYDPQTGQQRQQTLDAAQKALDADAVAALFNTFKKQQPKAPPPIPEDQVEPESSRATSVPQGAKIWTRQEIKQFYVDKTNGKYSADEGQRLEADIFAAQRENRIR